MNFIFYFRLKSLKSKKSLKSRKSVLSPFAVVCSGYPLKLHFQFPCVFPVLPHIFPVPLYVICDYYIHKTDLADLSSFKQIWEFSWQISKYLLPLESGNLQLEQTKFPVFWQNFQIPCVFPDREFFGPSSLFCLCSGYPVCYYSFEKRQY